MFDGNAVRLCALERRHVEATRAWASQAERSGLLDREWPASPDAGDDDVWIAALSGRRDRLSFAIETVLDGRHVGHLSLLAVDWRHRKAEIQLLIGESAEPAGYETESLSLASRYAFERLNLHRVFACVLASNRRARQAFENAGFVLEATLREDRWSGTGYSDVCLFGLLA